MTIPTADLPTLLGALMRDRRSVRGFTPDCIADDELASLLTDAQHAPSWCNIQPWRVAVTRPPFTQRLTAALLHAATTSVPTPEVPFLVEYPPPYRENRRACGGALYAAMGIPRDDKSGRHAAWLRNFAGFDAPHIMVVSVERGLGTYAYVDVGVWLGYLVAAAHARGIATCPMASIATYPDVLRRQLDIAASQTILFGIALGYEDLTVPANQCRTSRDPISQNVRWFPSENKIK